MSSPPSATPSDLTWTSVAPAAAGFAADLAERLDYGIRSGLLRDLHAVLVVRSGRIVLEQYYEGPDESWGRPLGQVAFGQDILHDLRSVTKSVVGLLYGIALERGLVPPPEAELLEQFPSYADLAGDPATARLKVEHALTMTLGTEWNEQSPYTSAANSEIAMEFAPDRLRFVLERPSVTAPGSRWTYCGGASALLGALISQGSGQTLAAFAQEALFAPLGITRFEWASGRDGVHSAASGLRLTARDLARIGELVLGSGKWAGRQVVPREWIEASARAAIPIGDGLEYGRQWFLGKAAVPVVAEEPQSWIAGFGNGGQRLFIMPSIATTTIVFGGNYNAFDAWVSPARIWREIVIANVLDGSTSRRSSHRFYQDSLGPR